MNWNSRRPTIGASSTPANPASIVPAIHAVAVTASVFTPAIDALTGWSTDIRVASPTACSGAGARSPPRSRSALTMTANWLVFSHVPNTFTKLLSTGLSTRPCGSTTSMRTNGKMIRTSAGMATQRPTVATSRTVGERWVSRRNSAP